MKLGLLYTFWTGDDLQMLLDSIDNHKSSVDKIVVCYQTKSNKGEFHKSDEFLDAMRDKALVIYYEPDLMINTKANERRKHNEMIEISNHLGCTHFIMAAADHFYSPEMIETGKQIMLESNYDLIVTRMKTFYKNKNWRMEPLENYFMPFIHKLSINTEISISAKYPVVVDPAVKVNTSKNIYIMPDDQGLMNHYSMIRVDIQKKFRNAAASIRWTNEQIKEFINEFNDAKVGDSIKYFQGRKIVLD